MNSTCGVVGYHVRLTRERSPVRARAVAFFTLTSPILITSSTPILTSETIITVFLFEKRVVEGQAASQSAFLIPIEQYSDQVVEVFKTFFVIGHFYGILYIL